MSYVHDETPSLTSASLLGCLHTSLIILLKRLERKDTGGFDLKGSSAAQLQIVEAALEGVNRSGEGMFIPHSYIPGSVDSSRMGLQA